MIDKYQEKERISRRDFIAAMAVAGISLVEFSEPDLAFSASAARQKGRARPFLQDAPGTPTTQVGSDDSTDHNSTEIPERQWALVIDLRLCDGCDDCIDACQRTHYLTPDQKWIDVYRMEGPSGQRYFMPRLCMHCENPPCEKCVQSEQLS